MRRNMLFVFAILSMFIFTLSGCSAISQTFGKDVLSCKGVESITPKLQGSSAICGTFGRTIIGA